MALETLLESFREVLKDNRYERRAITISCVDPDADSCVLEITETKRLITTVFGGTAPNLNIDLTLPQYNTIGKLQNYLATNFGTFYHVTLAENADEDHPSDDVESTGPVEIKSEAAYEIFTHIFSTSFLTDIVNRSVKRHNPSYNPDTIPNAEEPFVLYKAQADAYRSLANDAIRRTQMGLTVAECLALADHYEGIYAEDLNRLHRVVAPPRESSEPVGSGDVMVGDMLRYSYRSGREYPISDPISMDAPVNWLPIEHMYIADTEVELKVTRKRPASFFRLEVWRDTRPNVQRSDNHQLRPTSSKLVLAAHSGLVDTFRDSGLEPGTTYYYRVYIIDRPGEYNQSEVLEITTKPLRARFRSPPVYPLVGVAGSQLTVYLSNYVEGATTLDMEGKPLLGTWNPGTSTYTATVPIFNTPGSKHMVVTSTETGLIDVAMNAFQVVA